MAPIKTEALNCSELCSILIQVLTRLQIPASITLINTSLLSLLKRSPITEEFLNKNRNTFSLQVIGSDLKISLRHKQEVKNLSPESENATRLCCVIEKDLRKLDSIKEIIKQEKKTEITYDDFITKYNTKKKRINIAFIVRNSHSLNLYRRDQQTFVQFDNSKIEMGDEEIYEILKSNDFETILVRCLKSLLSSFFVPINLGSLQSCFSLGSFIDKDFLMKYVKFFQGTAETGIKIKDGLRNEIDTAGSKFVLELTEDYVCTKATALVLNTTENKSSDTSKRDMEVMSHIQNALECSRSLVIVGEGDKDAILFNVVETNDRKRLTLLKNMQEIINEEIQKNLEY